MKNNKIMIIVDELPLHHPKYINELIYYFNKNNWITNVCIIKKNKNKKSLNDFFIKKFFFLSLRDKFKLILLKLFITLFNLVFKKGYNNVFYSVESVLKYYSITHYKICNDINLKKNIDFIKKFQPDFILSSNSQIFSNDLIKIPKIACINRHSSLLPSYKGLMPIFHAINNNELNLGVTIHLMTDRIDDGDIVIQKKLQNLNYNNLNDIYSKIFNLSISCTIEAIEILLNNKEYKQITGIKESYFSRPLNVEISEFYKKKYSFF